MRRASGSARILCATLAVLAVPQRAAAQLDTQLWSEFNLTWIQSSQLTLGVDVEPKVLVSSQDPGWATLDVTPSIEYTRGEWFDVLGEVLVGRTKQTDDLSSTEITPRIGFRLHFLSNLRDRLEKERRPKRRLVIKDLLRFEWRNLHYSDGRDDSSTGRVRNRLEFLFPVTKNRITDDGATYLLADAEWFWPFEEPGERFASKQRVRGGVGYRRSFAWRFEALYIWDRARDSADDTFSSSDQAFDLRIRRVW